MKTELDKYLLSLLSPNASSRHDYSTHHFPPVLLPVLTSDFSIQSWGQFISSVSSSFTILLRSGTHYKVGPEHIGWSSGGRTDEGHVWLGSLGRTWKFEHQWPEIFFLIWCFQTDIIFNPCVVFPQCSITFTKSRLLLILMIISNVIFIQ